MTKEKFVCETIDKALANCFNPEISCDDYNKYIRKVEGKLVSYVVKNKMSFNEFAQTDDLLVRMKDKKVERIRRHNMEEIFQ